MKTIKDLLEDKEKLSVICGASNAMIAKLAENAGFDGAVVAGKLLDQKDNNWGFNAQSGEYQNLVKSQLLCIQIGL